MSFPPILKATVVALLVLTIGTTADARRRKSEWARYQDPVMVDSLMARTEYPGSVILDRERVAMTHKGDGVQAAIEREWVIFVRDPEAMADLASISFDEFPGDKIEKLEGWKITTDREEKVDVHRSDTIACDGFGDYRTHTVDFGDLAAGDVLAIRVERELEGRNPVYTHRFDHDRLPVQRSDVILEVPSKLMDGTFGHAWHWWAGTLARGIPQEHWEKPTTWRFRYATMNRPPTPPGADPMEITSSWVFDPLVGRLGSMVASDGTVGGTEQARRGPRVSVHTLTGKFSQDVTEGERDGAGHGDVAEAAFGDLSWRTVGEQWHQHAFSGRIDKSRKVRAQVERIVSPSMSARERATALLTDINQRIATADLPLQQTIDDLDDPIVTDRRDCATAVNKAILLAAMLRECDVASELVFLKHESAHYSLASLAEFDAVGLSITSPEGSTFVNLGTNEVGATAPGGEWSAAFTVGPDGSSRLAVGEELAALAH